MLGVGLAAAVLIDATVVRGILLPAAMALLGERVLVPAALAGLAARRGRSGALARGAPGRRAALAGGRRLAGGSRPARERSRCGTAPGRRGAGPPRPPRANGAPARAVDNRRPAVRRTTPASRIQHHGSL